MELELLRCERRGARVDAIIQRDRPAQPQEVWCNQSGAEGDLVLPAAVCRVLLDARRR
jgi:hypothetical protein